MGSGAKDVSSNPELPWKQFIFALYGKLEVLDVVGCLGSYSRGSHPHEELNFVETGVINPPATTNLFMFPHTRSVMVMM